MMKMSSRLPFFHLCVLPILVVCYSTPVDAAPISTQSLQKDCANGELDLVFILDSSGSVGRLNFESLVKFVVDVMADLPVGEDKIRLGIVRYSTLAQVIAYLMDNVNNDTVSQTLYRPGRTYTNRALELVRESVLTEENGDRLEVPDLIVLITDGISVHPTQTMDQANLLKEKQDLRILVIGVGRKVGQLELDHIASSPEMVWNASSYHTLQTMVKDMAAEICFLTAPTRTASSMISTEPSPSSVTGHESSAVPQQQLTTTTSVPQQQLTTTTSVPQQQLTTTTSVPQQQLTTTTSAAAATTGPETATEIVEIPENKDVVTIDSKPTYSGATKAPSLSSLPSTTAAAVSTGTEKICHETVKLSETEDVVINGSEQTPPPKTQKEKEINQAPSGSSAKAIYKTPLYDQMTFLIAYTTQKRFTEADDATSSPSLDIKVDTAEEGTFQETICKEEHNQCNTKSSHPTRNHTRESTNNVDELIREVSELSRENLEVIKNIAENQEKDKECSVLSFLAKEVVKFQVTTQQWFEDEVLRLYMEARKMDQKLVSGAQPSSI